MHQCQATGEVWVGEVGEILPHLHGRQHAFVNDVCVAQRADVEIGMVHPFLYFLSDDIQCPAKVLQFVVAYAGDEHLSDGWLCAQGCIAQTFAVCRHVAQMHQLKALALDFLYHHAEDFLLCMFVLGQEHQSCSVFSLLRHRNALKQDELMRNLNHDACSVAVLPDFCSPVSHVLEHTKCVVHELVALVAVDVHDHTYAAGVVLVRLLVQPRMRCLNVFS